MKVGTSGLSRLQFASTPTFSVDQILDVSTIAFLLFRPLLAPSFGFVPFSFGFDVVAVCFGFEAAAEDLCLVLLPVFLFLFSPFLVFSTFVCKS